MDVLELAIKARIPFITVTTRDLVHVKEVLNHISGEDTRPFNGSGASSVEKLDGNVFISQLEDPPTAELWKKFRAAAKTLIFVNPSKPSSL